MAHIDLRNSAPGILGLMAYKPSTAAALSQLAETILRGPSGLSQGERELIAGIVSFENDCDFCHRSHAAAAEACLEQPTGFTAQVARNIDGAPVSPKLKALLKIARKVQQKGKDVAKEDVAQAKAAGASEEDVHDTVLIAAAFCMFNRYVDGLETFAPPEGDDYYLATGKLLSQAGYLAGKPT